MADLNDYDSNKAAEDDNNSVDPQGNGLNDSSGSRGRDDEKSVSTKSRDDVKVQAELRL